MKYMLYGVLLLLIKNTVSNNTEWSPHEKLIHVYSYNETLSPKIEELNTFPPCSISVTWSCDQCAEFGLSKYIVYWSDGTEENSDVNDTTFSYVINGLDAAANYSVIVSAVYEDNEEYESNSAYAVTDVGDPPGIAYINVNSVSATEISLSWTTTNEDCPVKGYDIQYVGVVLCFLGEYDSGSEFSTETSMNLTGLTPYTEYNISIAAISTDEIYGNVTVKEYVETDTTVPGPPDKLVSFPLSSSSVQVSWEPPTNCSGFIYDYIISWKLTGDETIIGSDDIYYPLNYTVNGLMQCEDYDFLVSARTYAGEGDPATSTSRTYAEAPQPMESLASEDISSRSVVLTWTPADTPCPFNYTLEGNGTVLWDNQNIADEVVVPGNDTSYEADNLIPWTNYSVCITATTEGGSSEPACTEFQTLEDVPSEPENLTHEVLSTSKVRVRWKPPDMLNGELLHYTIKWGTENDTDEVASNVTNYTIKRLSACVEYTVSVTGATEVGEGEPAITKPVMDAEKAGKITSVNCEYSTSTTLYIEWAKPDTACKVNYTVSAVGSILWNGLTTIHTKRTDQEYIILTELVPYTTYSTTIIPETEAGFSVISDPCAATTKQGVPGIPTNLTVVEESITSDGFKITWNEPEVKNGQIMRFKVTLNNDETFFVYYESPCYTYWLTYKNLQSGHRYVVDVYAETSADFGPPSETSVTTLDDSNLGLILGITIPVIVIIIIAAFGIGHYRKMRSGGE